MILGLLLAGALGAELHGSGVVGADGEIRLAPQARHVRRFRNAFTGIARECGPRGCFRPGEDPGARHLRTVQNVSYAERGGRSYGYTRRFEGEFWQTVEAYDGKTCTDTTTIFKTSTSISPTECAEVCKRNPECKYFSLSTTAATQLVAAETQCIGCTADWGRRADGSYFSVQEVAEGVCTGCKAHFGATAYVITERTKDCPSGKFRSQRTGDCVVPEVEGTWQFSTCGEALTRGKCTLDRWVATHCCNTCVEDCRCDRTIYYVEGKQYDTKTFKAEELNTGTRGMEQAITKCRGYWNDPDRGDEIGTSYGFAVRMRSNGDGVCRRVREPFMMQELDDAKSTLGLNKVGAICDVFDIPTPTDAQDAAANGGTAGAATVENCPKNTCDDCTSKGDFFSACMQCQSDACRCKPTASEDKNAPSPNDVLRPCTWHTKSAEGENVCSCKNMVGQANDPEDYLNWWHTTTPAPGGMR